MRQSTLNIMFVNCKSLYKKDNHKIFSFSLADLNMESASFCYPLILKKYIIYYGTIKYLYVCDFFRKHNLTCKKIFCIVGSHCEFKMSTVCSMCLLHNIWNSITSWDTFSFIISSKFINLKSL